MVSNDLSDSMLIKKTPEDMSDKSILLIVPLLSNSICPLFTDWPNKLVMVYE